MAVKFKFEKLQTYQLTLDPDVWIRYVPLTEDESQAFQEVNAIPAEERSDAMARAAIRELMGVIREMWCAGTGHKDHEDIADTLMHTPSAMTEVVSALVEGSTVSEDEAPF